MKFTFSKIQQIKIRIRFINLYKKLILPLNLITIISSVIIIILAILGINYFVKLIINDIRPVMGYYQLYFYFFIPFLLFYFNFILIIQILIQRIRKQPGSFLRFKIISFFFLSIIIPSLIFIVIFVNFFDRVLVLLDNKAIISTLANKLDNYQSIIKKKEPLLYQDIINKLEKGNFQIKDTDIVDYVTVYDFDGNLVFFNKKKNLIINAPPEIDLSPILISNSQPHYFSYSEKQGYAYVLYRSETPITSLIRSNVVITNYHASLQFVDNNLKISILDTLDLIKQIRQLNVLIKPTSYLILFIFIYLYFQIYSIAVIIFYYRSKSYTKPIEELILTTKKISAGDWNKINLKPFINKMDENEIKQLLISFSNMIRDFIDNKKRLERLSNVEAWKEVATRLAHELKNPLTPIKLATNEIENYLSIKDLSTYANLQNKFQFIHSEVEQIEKLIKDFSHLSHNIIIKRKSFGVTKLINSVEGYLLPYPEINFYAKTIWNGTVILDFNKMKQVLINLIQNAIDSVLSKKKNMNNYVPYIELIINRINNILTLEIIDNGIGIDENKKEEIFKPYMTNKKNGTGLGLTICEEIVTLHHGKIEQLNLNGKTSFKIILPLKN